MRRKQVLLQLEAIHSRHRYVEDRAGNTGKLRRVEEIAGGGKDRSPETDQHEETLESLAERLIIIDDRDQSLIVFCFR